MTRAFIVGAGPGDAELLTIAAHRAIASADVVLFDRLISREILAVARPEALLIDVGKNAGEQDEKQSQIFNYFDEYAHSDLVIVRLKGGDPFVFGRGFEEYVYLVQLGYEVKIIPGITSAIGAAELAGIPVTCRGKSRAFAVITGHCCSGCGVDWPKYAKIDTLVILMGVKERQSIAQALIDAGRPPFEPIAFVENGSLPDQLVTRATLAAVASGQVDIRHPAVFVVGEVAALDVNGGIPYEDYGFTVRKQPLLKVIA